MWHQNRDANFICAVSCTYKLIDQISRHHGGHHGGHHNHHGGHHGRRHWIPYDLMFWAEKDLDTNDATWNLKLAYHYPQCNNFNNLSVLYQCVTRTKLLRDPEVTANKYCKSRNLPNTDTQITVQICGNFWVTQ